MTNQSRVEQESERIDLFFRNPSAGNPADERRACLFVLRRDLCDLLGPERSVTPDIKTPMLAAAGMLSGIDLMAWTTTSPEDPSRTDFVAFLTKYGGMAADDAQALYQYRCAQMHSYGFFSIRKQGKRRTEHTFTLDPSLGAQNAITHRPNAAHSHNYVVALFPLRSLFLDIVERFERAVKTDLPTRAAFLAAIEKIGFLRVTGWSI